MSRASALLGFFALLLLALAAVPAPAPASAKTQSHAYLPMVVNAHSDSAAASATSGQQYSLRLHNQARAAAGHPPLALDDRLNLAATRNAEDMATRGYFAHVSPDGKQPWDWMRDAGVTFGAAAQNIGLDPSGALASDAAIERLFNMMMAETPPNDGHHVNILNTTYRRLGVGVATNGSKLYWVVDFAD